MIRRLTNALLRLIYPPHARCYGCGSLRGNEHAQYLCDDCLRLLTPVLHTLTSERFMDVGIGFCCAPFHYETPVRGLIHAFKYGSMPSMAEYLAGFITSMLRQYGFTEYDLIAYVPLHRRRQYTRGYNQSRLLAQYVSSSLGIPLYDGLIRTRNTRQQALLSHADRRTNLQGAFRCTQPCEGKRVLLMDDVLTTGSTVRECAQVLFAQGVQSVDICTLAIASDFKKTYLP